MNKESVLVDELTTIERVLIEVVGLNERYVRGFRQIMFRKQLNKKEFLITEDKICDFRYVSLTNSLPAIADEVTSIPEMVPIPLIKFLLFIVIIFLLIF